MNIVNHKSQTKLSSFSVVFHGSTMNERPGWYGLSHLMEHLMCKNFEHLFDDFDRNGISWNAYTSETNIVFYMQGLEQYVNKYKREFLNSLLTNFSITPEILENEKKIVLEEYTDVFNNQPYAHIMNLFRKKFNRYTAIGLKDDIAKTCIEDVNKYFDLYLSKPSKIINIVNDEKGFIDNMGIKEFGDTYKKEKIIMGTYDNDFELNNDFKDKDSIVLLSPVFNSNFSELKLATLMLGYNLKSPLMYELREKRGLVYGIDIALDNLNDDQGYIYLMAQSRKGNSDEVINIVNDIYNNPEKFVTRERFDLIKNLLSITYQKSEIERYKNTNKYIKQPLFDLETDLPNITYDNVMNILKSEFQSSKWYQSIDSEEFKK